MIVNFYNTNQFIECDYEGIIWLIGVYGCYGGKR